MLETLQQSKRQNESESRDSKGTQSRILMLTQRFPFPPDRGDRIRAYHLLKFLAKYYRVCLASTTHEQIPESNATKVREFASEVLVDHIGKWSKYSKAARYLATGQSISAGYFHSSKLVEAIKQSHASEPFDAVLVYCSSMFQYRRLAGLDQLPTVVDLVDVDSQKWKQLAAESKSLMRFVYGIESKRTRSLEREIASKVHSIALTSEEEAKLFHEAIAPKSAVFGISNGVDTTYFESREPKQPASSSSPLQVVFTGVMDYQPNVEGMLWFCNEVWPKITSQISATLKIVGRNPTPAVSHLSKTEGVEVVGEVPDIRPYLYEADIAVSPLQLARGIQNKVLEAMACSLPVVLTSQCAEGIDAESGEHFQIADDANGFAHSVISLAKCQQRRQQLGRSARFLVEQEYSWPARLAGFRDLIEKACTN